MTSTSDQTWAAFEDAARTVAAAPSVSFKKTPITNRMLSKWIHGGKFKHGLADTGAVRINEGWRFVDHDWTSCGHLPTPQLCFGLAHLPGHLMCANCWFAAAEQAEDRCDWCGIGPHHNAPLHAALYPIGPAVVLMTLCPFHVATPDYSQDVNWPRYLRHIIATHN